MVSGVITNERHRPEATTLHQVVQENLETLYGAVDVGHEILEGGTGDVAEGDADEVQV